MFREKLGEVSKCIDILEELGLDHATEADCHNVRYVCECVSRRAAYLAGAGAAVLLNRISEDHITVAVDGSVYRFHPYFHSVMVEAITKVIQPGLKVSAPAHIRPFKVWLFNESVTA